jgi:rhamnosyltransferase
VTSPLVSIVLPTRNGARTLPALLDALSRQRVSFDVETVAVDSGSTDGTVDLLRGRVDRLVTIAAESFDHGLTRNLGIENSRGELIVLLVQDALPASDTWLAELTAPLLKESRANGVELAGAFARQVPRPDASAVTRHYHARWVAAADAPRAVTLASGELAALDPMQRYLRCAFDNVCSCIRRSVWQRHPFRATPIGEDIEWAREVLLAGYRLAYVPQAAVVHSHDRPARYELARTYTLHRRLYELFQLRTIPTMGGLFRAIGTSSLLHWRCYRDEQPARRSTGEMARALSLAVAWPLGQYMGGLSAARGWKSARSRNV